MKIYIVEEEYSNNAAWADERIEGKDILDVCASMEIATDVINKEIALKGKSWHRCKPYDPKSDHNRYWIACITNDVEDYYDIKECNYYVIEKEVKS